MDLTVVIIGKEVESTLSNLIHSVRQETDAPILYIDSDSKDSSLEIAKKLGVQTASIIAPLNAAKARNKGLELASSDLILFLDGDTELIPHFLEKALPYFKDPKVAAVYGRRLEKYPESSYYHFIVDYEWELSEETGRMGGDVLARRALFKEAGGYNNLLKAAEDTDLFRRLTLKGYSVQFIPYPMTYHDIRMKSLKSYWKRAQRTGYGYASVYFLHKNEPGEFWEKEFYRSLFKGIFLLLCPLFFLLIALFDLKLFGLSLLYLSVFVLYKMAALKRGTFTERLFYTLHSQLVHIPHLFGEIEYFKERRWSSIT